MPGSACIRAQLVAEARFLQETARRGRVLLGDQDPARQNSDRALEHAHVLVEDQMRDGGTIQQGRDRGDQDRIIGAYELAQGTPPLTAAGGRDPCRAPFAPDRPRASPRAGLWSPYQE